MPWSEVSHILIDESERLVGNLLKPSFISISRFEELLFSNSSCKQQILCELKKYRSDAILVILKISGILVLTPRQTDIRMERLELKNHGCARIENNLKLSTNSC